MGHRGYIFFIYSNPNSQAVPDSKLQEFFSSIEFFMPELMGLDRMDTLVMLGGDPAAEELDPAVSVSGAGGYVGLLYSGLVRLSPSLPVVPDLAESWSVGPDGLVYTFNLRPRIRFASGRPITAQDFKDSWERATSAELGSETARAYLGDILGGPGGLDSWHQTGIGLMNAADRLLGLPAVLGQSTGDQIYAMALFRQTSGLFEKHPLGAANHPVNRDIRNKKKLLGYACKCPPGDSRS